MAFIVSVDTVAKLIARLDETDAESLLLIDRGAREQLDAAARNLPFRRARPVIGEGERAVRQAFEVCEIVPAGNPLWEFAGALGRFLNDALSRLDPSPVYGPFGFNDLIVQRYAAASGGITPHRDHLRYENLVAIITLSGSARFFVCADRSGVGAREVPAPPGSLLLMRAPGFANRRDRPFHFLRDVAQERISLGLRHDVRAH